MTFLRFFLPILMLLLQACAVGPEEAEESGKTGILVDGLIIRNELHHAVTDVMIEVPATGAFAGCGNIIARTSCSTSFPEVEYRANALQLSWREHGQPQGTGEFVVEVPAGLTAGDSVWVEVIIFAPGQAGARLSQPD